MKNKIKILEKFLDKKSLVFDQIYQDDVYMLACNGHAIARTNKETNSKFESIQKTRLETYDEFFFKKFKCCKHLNLPIDKLILGFLKLAVKYGDKEKLITFNFSKDNKLTLKCKGDPQYAEFEQELEVTNLKHDLYEDFSIGINAKYLNNAISNFDTINFRFGSNDYDPIYLTDSNKEFEFIIMPVKIYN